MDRRSIVLLLAGEFDAVVGLIENCNDYIKDTMPTVTQQLNKELEVVKLETAPVIAIALALAVTDPQSYAIADSFLSKLVAARKTVKTRLARILDPLKDALKEAQSLLKEVDSPLEEAELVMRGRMRDYKLEESRQARIEEDKRQAEAERLRQEAAKKLLAESKAKTQQMKDKLAAQRVELETKADVAEAAPTLIAVKTAGSTTRVSRKPTLVDFDALIKGVVAGIVPSDIIQIDYAQLRLHYRSNPQAVAKYPGIEMVDDIQIVHRGM